MEVKKVQRLTIGGKLVECGQVSPRIGPLFITLEAIYRRDPVQDATNILDPQPTHYCETREVDVLDGTKIFVMRHTLSFVLI